jgi:hypothetical protein
LGEFDQSMLYVFMKIPQWNPFVQLIYTNKNLKFNKVIAMAFVSSGYFLHWISSSDI